MNQLQARAAVKAGMKVYLLSEVKDPPRETFVNFSGFKMNTIRANDVTYFDEPNAVVQNEPADAFDPYDLQVEEHHNFVAEGLVVHNSHSAAYALLSYHTAWLKLHSGPSSWPR